MFHLKFNPQTKNNLHFNFHLQQESLDGPINPKDKVKEYEGDYNVTPDFNLITLETKNKLMKQDVTVEEIPHFLVSNTTGQTFIIGKGDLKP